MQSLWAHSCPRLWGVSCSLGQECVNLCSCRWQGMLPVLMLVPNLPEQPPDTSCLLWHRYLLRLGMGEQELATEEEFSRVGRVNAMLARRLALLAEVGVCTRCVRLQQNG